MNLLSTITTVSLLTTTLAGDQLSPDQKTTPVYSSCSGLSNGQYYLRLSPNLPIIYATCSNEFVIIDYNSDNQWSDYFTSWYKYHYGIAGPTKGDSVNWENWFLPDSGSNNVNYLISKDCNTCDSTTFENEDHGLQSTYYMNASSYSCFSFGRSKPGCDMTYDTYECRACINTGNQLISYIVDEIPNELINSDQVFYYGNCYLERIESNYNVDQTYSECTASESGGAHKPSIGTDGRNCICAKLGVQDTLDEYRDSKGVVMENINEIEKENIDKKRLESKNVVETEKVRVGDKIVYLYQKDFESGTYRIKESGVYIIMEDIIFDFNSPWTDEWNLDNVNMDNYSPNSEGYWWPRSDQNDLYPHTTGQGDFSQAYFAGFFTGISIECDDVTIDLNNKELKMSKEYFYSQPHWSHIDLASQPFRPGVGLGFFGPEPKFANNVIIKDGIMGLTSHHCIHGSSNKNVKIENIVCQDFVTHGIQLNGFEDIELNNIEIGPNNNEAWLTADYMVMRALLPRFRYLADKYPIETVQFGGKADKRERSIKSTMSDLLDELVTQMDMAYKHIVYGIEYETDDPTWQSAKQIFIKDEGIPNGGVMYGLFLNYHASGIPGYYYNADLSNTAKISNIYIHDLIHKTQEALYFGGKRVAVNPLTVPLKINHVVGEDNFAEYYDGNSKWKAVYTGTIVTDITIAMHIIAENDNDNWGLLGFSYLGDDLYNLATSGWDRTMYIKPRCAGDEFIHNVKGTMGMRVNGVQNVILENIKVENILEQGALGSDKCGSYSRGHITQQMPYQIGYTGNRAQGLSIAWSDVSLTNFEINNIRALTGASFGMALWPGAEVTAESGVVVKEVVGGINVEMGLLGTDDNDLPNYAPEACGVRIYSDLYMNNKYHDNDESATLNIINSNNNDNNNDNIDNELSIECVTGHVGCLLEDEFDGENTECSAEFNAVLANFQAVKQSKGKNNFGNIVLGFAALVAILFIMGIVYVSNVDKGEYILVDNIGVGSMEKNIESIEFEVDETQPLIV